MSAPAKDEAELTHQISIIIQKSMTAGLYGPNYSGVAKATIAAIREAGWAVVPVEPICVNAHDRCYGGAGGPCPYCEMPAAPEVKP